MKKRKQASIKYVKGEGWYVMDKLTDDSVRPAKVEWTPYFGPYLTRTQAQGVWKVVNRKMEERFELLKRNQGRV